MEKIEVMTPEPEKAVVVLQNAIDQHKRLLLQSIERTQERIETLAAELQVDTDRLLTGDVPHPEDQDMDLLELEGELEILRHLREQVTTLDHLTLCP